MSFDENDAHPDPRSPTRGVYGPPVDYTAPSDATIDAFWERPVSERKSAQVKPQPAKHEQPPQGKLLVFLSGGTTEHDPKWDELEIPDEGIPGLTVERGCSING